MKVRRLRISQQLIIVFTLAVLFPLCVVTLIVTNINQHAVRKELRYSAKITTDNIHQRIVNIFYEKKQELWFITKSINYINSPEEVKRFIKEISSKRDGVSSIKIINKNNDDFTFGNLAKKSQEDISIIPDLKNGVIRLYANLNSDKYIEKTIELERIKEDLFKNLINDKRQVYIIDSSKNKIIMSYNEDLYLYKTLVETLPSSFISGVPEVFGSIKNQPNVFLKMKEPDWSIIVATPKHLIDYGIIYARFKIITSIIVSAFVIIIFGAFYSYSLNRNIKQLFKGVAALGRGNYQRKIRLVKDFFTPYEVVYLVEKFNTMAEKIDNSYDELKIANEQLSKLDKLKSTLIDTVSHEFRTPLTSIKGYTSRLLRNDVNIDEATKTKSLKVVKNQAERLSRLVDDLLVVPEIESSLLRTFPENINIGEILEDCILSIQQKSQNKIILEADNSLPNVYADPDRVMQVIINLLDNAVKYSKPETDIKINVGETDKFAVIKIKNDCNEIPREKVQSLFDKFTRLEEELTRTTRGTGLGLFIVKGLVNAMGGEISLSVDDGFEVSFSLPLA